MKVHAAGIVLLALGTVTFAARAQALANSDEIHPGVEQKAAPGHRIAEALGAEKAGPGDADPATQSDPGQSPQRPADKPVVEGLPIFAQPLSGVQLPTPDHMPTAAPPALNEPGAQKESGWYAGGSYSFNLLNLEYYDYETRDVHFSGQRRDISNHWNGLATLLNHSKNYGFVRIRNKFINMRNLSAIYKLGDGGNGATLTFRDGATLLISSAELERLMEVTQ